MVYNINKVYIKTPKCLGWYFTENFYLIDTDIKNQLNGDNDGS